MSALSPIRRLARRLQLARLAMAEQDLAWMQTVGRSNLDRQSERVAELRRRLGRNSTLPLDVSSDDIARAADRRARENLIA